MEELDEIQKKTINQAEEALRTRIESAGISNQSTKVDSAIQPTPGIRIPQVSRITTKETEQASSQQAQPQAQGISQEQPPTPPSTAISPPQAQVNFPKIPENVSDLTNKAASNVGIFLKKNVTKYLTFSNLVTTIFTGLGAVAGAILGKGSALSVVAGAGAGGIGSTYLRSPAGRRFIGNFGSNAINRTVGLSNRFSTQSLIKGPSKKIWIGILVGFLALTTLGAAFSSSPTSETSPSKLFEGTLPPPANSDYAKLHEDILNTFKIDMDNSFSYDYLKWTWEKFSSIKNTKFFGLVNSDSRTVRVIRDDSQINAQIGCSEIRMRGISSATGQPYPEPLFKVVLIHELSHIIDSCNLDSISHKSQLSNIRDQEGYITNYSANAATCVGSNNLNEDYAEMITYYLNPEFSEQSLRIGTACEPTITTNPYAGGKKPLHQNLASTILGVSGLSSGITAVGKLSCLVDNGQISTPSYQANNIAGHCGEIYTSQGYVCDPNSRRAKSVDILTGGPNGKDVKLPTVNGKSLEWTFITKPQDTLYLNRSDCLPNEMLVGFNCGIGIAFQTIDQEGSTWTLQLLHMYEPSIQAAYNSKYSSGGVVGKTEAIHTHVTIGKNISGDINFAIAGSNDTRSGWIPADLEMKMCI
jgi:hypothetical protein